MIKKKAKRINAIILIATLLLCVAFPIKSKAASSTGTTFVTGGTSTAQTSYQMRYNHYTAVRSDATAEDETIAGNYKHYLEFTVPIDIRTTYDCYYNGGYRQNLIFTLNMNGSSLYSIVRNYEIYFTPNTSIPSEQLMTCVYQSGVNATGYTMYLYMVAANFHCWAAQSQEIGYFTFKFWLTSPLDTLNQISLDLTAGDSASEWDLKGTYEVGSGLTGNVLKAIDYAFSNYAYNDFLRDVHAYLFGMDSNAYDIVDLLKQMRNQNNTLYTLLQTQLEYLASGQNTTNRHLLNINLNFMAKYEEILQVLIQIRDGPTETDAEAALESAGARLESAGAQLVIQQPNIDNNIDQLNGYLSDPNIAAAQGNLFAWISNGFVLPIIIVALILGVLGFVLYGKH